MAEEQLQTCAYRVLRYVPNLVRDEFFNIGVLLFDPAGKRLEARLMENENEFARLRRLHPTADLELVRGLEQEFAAQMAAFENDPAAYVAKLDETLSNVLQLSPQRAVMTEDFDAEMDRLFSVYVEPPRYAPAPAEAMNSRSGIRARASDIFRRAGILPRLQRSVRVDEFTFRGDPVRMDYAYQRNGTRGFVQVLALARDPAQAKALAFTTERIRAKIENSEFTAITEVEPRAENERHQFVAGLLREQGIALVAVPQLDRWARDLGARLR